MGAVKDLMMRYCEAIHPDSWDKQDELFMELCEGNGPELDEIARVVDEFEKSGRRPQQPALTLHRVCHALGIKKEDNHARPDG